MRRLVEKDYSVSAPARFLLKDLRFAAAEAERTGTNAELLTTLRDQFTSLTAEGLGDLDIAVTQAYVASRRPGT